MRLPAVWFSRYWFRGLVLAVSLFAPPPLLEWLSSPPLVAASLISPKGAESPGSSRMGVIGVFGFLSSEAV